MHATSQFAKIFDDSNALKTYLLPQIQTMLGQQTIRNFGASPETSGHIVLPMAEGIRRAKAGSSKTPQRTDAYLNIRALREAQKAIQERPESQSSSKEAETPPS
jgi:hypothetical protein